MTEDLQLRTVIRLEPNILSSMGEIKAGDLFMLEPVGGEDPSEDGKDIYVAQGDAFPEKPEGNHGIPAVQVGRNDPFTSPGDLKDVKVTLTLTFDGGVSEEYQYQIHPQTLNLSEMRPVHQDPEDMGLNSGVRRVVVLGDVI